LKGDDEVETVESYVFKQLTIQVMAFIHNSNIFELTEFFKKYEELKNSGHQIDNQINGFIGLNNEYGLQEDMRDMGENDGEDYETPSRGVEYGIDPYQEQPDMDEPQFDFVTSAIESASGDKVERRGVDDYGRDIYFSLNNNNVTYFIGDNEDDIILYNGETGERYPIGKLKHYDEPRRAKDDPNNIYF
jgi:hypothetical protein